jgi:rSAM/selenodomain-associated transferase 2
MAASEPCVSIIVPVLNEAHGIEAFLAHLQVWRAHGHEVLLVDGGSTDHTIALAQPHVDQLISAPAGRASQMNLGAAVSRGQLLLFLHADTLLPRAALPCLQRIARNSPCAWGRFDVRLSGSQPLLRVVEGLMNWRSRLSGIATGDQAMFVTRTLFERVGGYPAQPLMEDVALSAQLRRECPPHCLRLRVITSSRRWEAHGILRTIGQMWWLRWRYFMGADPALLAAQYRAVRELK